MIPAIPLTSSTVTPPSVLLLDLLDLVLQQCWPEYRELEEEEPCALEDFPVWQFCLAIPP